MKDIRIDKKTERCFILKDDVAATIVIPISKLMPVDYHRLKNIEAKGGEMLQKMRDEELDNGRNALKQYEPFIQIVKKESFEQRKEEESKREFDPELTKSETEGQDTATQKQKRGPGRPRGTGKKKASAKSENEA